MPGRTVPPPHEVREQLTRLLASSRFQAPVLPGLLKFLVDTELAGKGAELNQLYVGLKGLGKPENWTPETGKMDGPDDIVRIHINHLRQALDRHYADPTLNDPVKIAVPKTKGKARYRPTFEYRESIARYPGLVEPLREAIAEIHAALMKRTVRGESRARRVAQQLDELTVHAYIMATFRNFVDAVAQNRSNDGPPDWKRINRLLEVASEGEYLFWQTIFATAIVMVQRDHDYAAALTLFEEAAQASNGESLKFFWHTAILAAIGKFDTRSTC